jgi:hypothetical protein
MANVLDMASTTMKYSRVNRSETMVIHMLPKSRAARNATRMADPFCTIITHR